MKKGFSRKEYQERIKSIRAFVDFGLDARKSLSPSEKRMVTIYYEAIKKEKFSNPLRVNIVDIDDLYDCDEGNNSCNICHK